MGGCFGARPVWRAGWITGLVLLVAGANSDAAERPRLVVVMSVDQFCQDYLIRFHDNFTPDGLFRQVENKGAEFANCHHRHAFTITAPGHSVLLTGAYPNSNGMIANNWFDRFTGKDVYCVGDAEESIVGRPMGKGVSPRSLQVSTVGDVLKLATSGKGKVFGVAIKDRAAILMTGHLADGAYWLQDNYWVTSTYYRQNVPGYLRVLNEGQTFERFRGATWNLHLPKAKYHNTGPDDSPLENPPKGFDAAFPHTIYKKGEGTPNDYGEQVLRTPFGNDVTLEGARAIVLGEELGKDEFPDILAINFSTNDYVGHSFGPYSLEVEDLTYRLDLQLGEFARFLDEQVGAGKWTLALTSDHGVAPIPGTEVMNDGAARKIPAKRSPLGALKDVKPKLEAAIRQQLDVRSAPEKPLVLNMSENQVMLDWNHALLQGENFSLAQKAARNWLLAQPHVAAAVTRDDLLAGGASKLHGQLQKAFHPNRSGDVLYVLAPYCMPGGSNDKGTTHGSPWHYDTHVPLLLIGCGIEPGHCSRDVSPAALASTVAQLLGVDAPGGNVEEPLTEALAK